MARIFYGRPTEGGNAQQDRLGTNPADEPQLQAALLTRTPGQSVIGQEEVRRATEILQKYKQGKANLENRIVEDELWYKLRHWEAIGKEKKIAAPEPTSAWLFNTIMNKHADAMDNYPEPITLPREQSDEDSAKILSSVLPVVFEQNDFEQVYSDAWWEKLKHGCPVYGVFWNSQKENGLGDIDIRNIDLLNIFWEPGITDIQDSKNLFIVALEDNASLEQQHPELQGKLTGHTIDVKQYQYDDNVDTSDKSVVVDWYYKVRGADGRTVLHYCKFVGDTVLYASENDPQYAQRGYYDHGKYPVVFDPLFPEKGTPVGFGYVALCKDPQMYIDKLAANIQEKALADTKKRYFASSSLNINKDQLLDVREPIITVEGDINDVRLREIVSTPISPIYVQIMQAKIDEMKDTAGNRDVNSGGSVGGVTAASAIAALQEAGNKSSRDMIKSSNRAFKEVCWFAVEDMRQFYDEARVFRIAAPNDMQQPAAGAPMRNPEYQFVEFSNAAIKEQVIGTTPEGVEMIRKPIFDIKIKAQKQNPFSRMEQNERAKELYGLGFFNPEAAQQALIALSMMDFEGIDKIREQIQQGQTLLQQVQQLQADNAQLLSILGVGGPVVGNVGSDSATGRSAAQPSAGGNDIADGMMQAHTPMTSYGQHLAKRSTPSLED